MPFGTLRCVVPIRCPTSGERKEVHRWSKVLRGDSGKHPRLSPLRTPRPWTPGGEGVVWNVGPGSRRGVRRDFHTPPLPPSSDLTSGCRREEEETRTSRARQRDTYVRTRLCVCRWRCVSDEGEGVVP